ncbi:MAG: signal peptidase I [Deltaproteobacteria bacterium]|nr:signal peptidase I [Deltaproteobacteria bacterium]
MILGAHLPDSGSMFAQDVLRMSRMVKILLGISAAVVLLLGSLLLFRVRYEMFRAVPGSMAPGIDAKDLLLVDRWTYGYHAFHAERAQSVGRAPRLGEVVILHKPNADRHLDSITRVVAIAGDTIELDTDGSLIVNGQPLPRCKLGASHDAEQTPLDLFLETQDGHTHVIAQLPDEGRRHDFTLQTVPEDSVFVLGDSRDNAVDSRVFGPVPLDHLMGRVVWVNAVGRIGSDPERPIIPVAMSAALARCTEAKR